MWIIRIRNAKIETETQDTETPGIDFPQHDISKTYEWVKMGMWGAKKKRAGKQEAKLKS